jgi:two-component system nitrate/nitrite response regulator NarL
VQAFIVGGSDRAATVNSIRTKFPLAPIVVVGESGATDEIAQALSAGANCYLRETIDSTILLKTLDLLTQKDVILSSELVRQDSPSLNGKYSSHILAATPASISSAVYRNGTAAAAGPCNGAAPGTKLSAQELVILQGLVEGAPNKVIANRLHITEATVKVHVKAILRKIPAKNRTQAAIWAVKHLPAQPRAKDELRATNAGYV